MNPVLIVIEEQMREHAIAIFTLYEKAKTKDQKAAKKMIDGIMEYIAEKSETTK